ncbi:MAG: histidine kinase, partial [Flavobacteriales bacterium]
WLWALAYRKRMRARLAAAEQEMKELRLRTRLAKDIHDDVGSGLARVAALARSPKRVTDAESRFEKMEAISSELLDNLRDVVWMNDPRNGTLDLLLIRLREFAQDLFEDSDATVRCDFPDPLPATSIGGAFRRNLMLIGREALHNARKYSGARNITLMWRMEGDSFLFTVSDDGVGLGAGGVQGGGQGSGNMRQRAEEVHAQFERTDREGGGTEVRVFGRPSCLDE